MKIWDSVYVYLVVSSWENLSERLSILAELFPLPFDLSHNLVGSDHLTKNFVGEKTSDVSLVRRVELVLPLKHGVAKLDRFDRLERGK